MINLKIFNTLKRKKQYFTPLKEGKVSMYVCGMTVYDYCHIGHARVMIVFDVVKRWLEINGFEVTYVRNITDIDDKIIKKSFENNESITDLTNRYIKAMNEDTEALGLEKPHYEPRATSYIPQMIDLIKKLEKEGLAYQNISGDVNFSVRDFVNYGKLSGKSLDDLKAGSRVVVDVNKKDPIDFVLWKKASSFEPSEAKWNSLWGKGRPGWHIECSAMSSHLLGNQIDIHGGGLDLQFPHHENEIAQSEGVFKKTFVQYWMHNGIVNVNNEKMSKSLGNFFTIREILKKYHPEVLRFFILRSHYRSPLNFSDIFLNDAKLGLDRLYITLNKVPPDNKKVDLNEKFAQNFFLAMNDDFNTPLAISHLFELATIVNKEKSVILSRQLKGLAGIIGLLSSSPQDFLKKRNNKYSMTDLKINELVKLRSEAKKNKHFNEADRIRSLLFKEGILLEDKPGGITDWRRS